MDIVKKIRKVPGAFSRNAGRENEDVSLNRDRILKESSSFFVREAYKALRTNIIFSLSNAGCKKLIVTSALASEGKSLNCLNLAISFAENGSKVLLIDCDLRRPTIMQLLDVPIDAGLSNYLVNLKSLDEIIKKSSYKNLDVIPSGDIPPNPAELLGSNRMTELVETLESRYDYIFMDSPPVNVVSDAVILSKMATGVLLVVRQGRTEKDSLEDAVAQLEFADARILGTILNGTQTNGNSYKYKKNRYYKYGSAYGSYSSHTQNH